MYCDCDDPRISNFFHYFSCNFKKLNLKKLSLAGRLHKPAISNASLANQML